MAVNPIGENYWYYLLQNEINGQNSNTQMSNADVSGSSLLAVDTFSFSGGEPDEVSTCDTYSPQSIMGKGMENHHRPPKITMDELLKDENVQAYLKEKGISEEEAKNMKPEDLLEDEDFRAYMESKGIPVGRMGGHNRPKISMDELLKDQNVQAYLNEKGISEEEAKNMKPEDLFGDKDFWSFLESKGVLKKTPLANGSFGG